MIHRLSARMIAEYISNLWF